jgi:proteasome lid subunit RPN8/RPN11
VNKIRVDKHQLEYFKRVARKNDPKEILAFLIGKVVSPTLTVVEQFIYIQHYLKQTSEALEWSYDEYERAAKIATEKGLSIVGSIHSHPNYWPILSETDHKDHIVTQNRITGIYAFMGKKGKVCFWVVDSALPLKVQYAEEGA